jgi:putative addiction module component (TIGR02574 family)
MTKAAQKLKAKLLELSERDREELAYFLLQSLGDGSGLDDKEWELELERRAKELREDPSKGIPAEKVHVQLRKKYK